MNNILYPCKCGKKFSQLDENLTGIQMYEHVDACNKKFPTTLHCICGLEHTVNNEMEVTRIMKECKERYEKDHPKKGTKNDSNYIDKPPLDLLTLEFLKGTAQALGFGANKYGRHNFREGIDHSRLIAAALRHINQYNSGTDEDGESGLSHLAHAAASLNMLMWMVENRPELDDRYKGNK